MAKTNMKTVQQVIRKRRLFAVHPEDMVRQACKIMNNRELGGLPVIDADQRLLGMISEREVVRGCIGEHRRAATTSVGEVMETNPAFAEPDDSIMIAMAKMMQNNVRYLPVVRGGIVTGCIGIRELVDELSYLAMQNVGIIDKALPQLHEELV